MTAEPIRHLSTAAVHQWLEHTHDRLREARNASTVLGDIRVHDAVEPLLAERDILRRRCELLEAAGAPSWQDLVRSLHRAVHGLPIEVTEPSAATAYANLVGEVAARCAELAGLRDRVAGLEARYRELELTAGANLDGAAQAVAELQAALAQLVAAADPYVTGADASSGQDMAAQSALSVAWRAARGVLERRGDDGPYVPIHVDHLSLLVGAVTESYRGPLSPEQAAAVDTAICLLQPDEPTDDTADLTPVHRPPAAEPIDGLVDSHKVRAVEDVRTGGAT